MLPLTPTVDTYQTPYFWFVSLRFILLPYLTLDMFELESDFGELASEVLAKPVPR
jgi:hypothetical protein